LLQMRELKRLWEEWKAQWAYSEECSRAYTAAEESVFDAVGPHWRLDSVVTPGFKSCDTFQARFIAFRQGEEISQLVPLDTLDMTEAYELAEKRLGDLIKKERASEKSAKRRCGYHAADRAYIKSVNGLKDIEWAIAEAPANSLHGIAIKLALWKFWQFTRKQDQAEDQAVDAAYEAVVKLAGLDLMAQIPGRS
jgi:hypothetical protein